MKTISSTHIISFSTQDKIYDTSVSPSVFLQKLFGASNSSNSAYLTLTAIHPSGKHSSPSRHIPLNQPQQLQEALQGLYAANEQAWGAFFGVATRKGDLGRWHRGGLADLASLPALFVDIDMPSSEAMRRLQGREPPSAIILSGYGVHAYWFLDEPSQNWQACNLALQRLRKDLQADRSSLAQSMRLPLSRNTKPERKNALCEILHLSEVRYPLEIFTPKSEVRQSYQAVSMRRQKSLKQFSERRQLNPRLIQAVSETLLRDCGGYWRKNGWLAAQCPCHHQQDKAGQHFSFHPEKGLGVCLGKHGSFLLKELAEVLGISPQIHGGFYLE